MYGEEKSDSLIVAAKQANNPKGAESVERRSGAKGNAEQPHMRRTQSRESMSQRLSRVREAAKQRKKERFTALFHLLTVEALEAAFLSLSRKAAAGVDGIRWMDYAGNMKNNITDLHRRLHQGSYRAQPGRRHYIPKADGKQRPLGIASLEDKIVQYALVKILNAVYENDFMGFSYGFRPGRSQHDALDALATGLVSPAWHLISGLAPGPGGSCSGWPHSGTAMWWWWISRPLPLWPLSNWMMPRT
ncbi:putative RetA reverse transcriptase [Citrobacter freundii GTC 09629]|nr:putative RetA reverse transcriptase [Citrobacter freundii GTC 09629]